MNRRNTDEDYEEDFEAEKTTKLFKREHITTEYTYYLDGKIGAASGYLDLCEMLRNALPEDQVTIRINSNGGLVATGEQIINAINESEAHVRGYIESSCGSMATMIFLACNGWGISPNAEFFIHTTSGGMFGKESETYAQSVFVRKKTHKAINRCYAGFLSDAEITKVLEGTDIYFDSEEIIERLDRYVAYKRSSEADLEDLLATKKTLMS